MKHPAKLFWFFAAIFIIELGGGIGTWITHDDAVIPIYHLGILTIVWQDYVKLTLFAAGCSMFFMWKAWEDS